MKKIGFIDLYLDEWHANNYPAWFRGAALGGEFELGGAWEKRPGTRPLDVWCKEMDIPAYTSMEKLLEDCDAFCVLAPSNPEVHEELAELPLMTGKPVYIDKPFAPDKATALRLFERADKYNTPLFSSSALRFGDELIAQRNLFPIEAMITQGGGSSFWEYSIHQIEMIVSTMGYDITALNHEVSGSTNQVTFRFRDGRVAAMTLHPKFGFNAVLTGKGEIARVAGATNCFPNLVGTMLKFFNDRTEPFDRRETIAIAALVRAGIEASARSGEWVSVDTL
ncbi:MAG: Gfo/Idh/MocA family oxidoreductase [Lentisphaeria bacterium]|nr:Gfo/Idh/MocA family oxidoreductase [Lentisphaeria bacterium]